jgi:hypothetical protein
MNQAVAPAGIGDVPAGCSPPTARGSTAMAARDLDLSTDSVNKCV